MAHILFCLFYRQFLARLFVDFICEPGAVVDHLLHGHVLSEPAKMKGFIIGSCCIHWLTYKSVYIFTVEIANQCISVLRQRVRFNGIMFASTAENTERCYTN